MALCKLGSFKPVLYSEVAANPANMATNATMGTVTLTVPGAVVGDLFLVFALSTETGLLVDPVGRCTTKGQVVVRYANLSGGALDPANQTFTVVGL